MKALPKGEGVDDVRYFPCFLVLFFYSLGYVMLDLIFVLLKSD